MYKFENLWVIMLRPCWIARVNKGEMGKVHISCKVLLKVYTVSCKKLYDCFFLEQSAK